MNFTTAPRTIDHRGPLSVLQTLCTLLAAGSLVTGSVLLSLLWLGDGNLSLFDFITVTRRFRGEIPRDGRAPGAHLPTRCATRLTPCSA